MILYVLYIYAQGQTIQIGGHPDPAFCWGIVHQLEAAQIVADCRITPITNAPETSPFPLPKPERTL